MRNSDTLLRWIYVFIAYIKYLREVWCHEHGCVFQNMSKCIKTPTRIQDPSFWGYFWSKFGGCYHKKGQDGDMVIHDCFEYMFLLHIKIIEGGLMSWTWLCNSKYEQMYRDSNQDPSFWEYFWSKFGGCCHKKGQDGGMVIHYCFECMFLLNI